MNEEADARRRRAIAAATRIAAPYGIQCATPRILKDSNNTVVHLRPAPVVAKVAVGHRGKAHARRELAVALRLGRSGAPIVLPSDLLPPGPHLQDGLLLTFWQYCPHGEADESDAQLAGKTLREVHEALRT